MIRTKFVKTLYLLLMCTLLVFPLFLEKCSAASTGAKNAVEAYKLKGEDYLPYMANYNNLGDYLNFGSAKGFTPDRFSFDNAGVPITRYGSEWHYNPVTVSQAGLHYYGKYLLTNDDKYKSLFMTQADKLIKMQGKDGALRYDFRYRVAHMGYRFQNGWVSGMAQGQALSVYSRAYSLTKDLKYKRAGYAALTFLLKDKSKGGPKTTLANISKKWSNNIWFEEYVMPGKDIYTLNGYMFTLLGLYDWSKVAGDSNAHGQRVSGKYFNEGVTSLKLLLPKYDIGGFTSYDLSHLTYKQDCHVVISYHKVHIYLVNALQTINNDSYLKTVRQKYISYVN